MSPAEPEGGVRSRHVTEDDLGSISCPTKAKEEDLDDEEMASDKSGADNSTSDTAPTSKATRKAATTSTAPAPATRRPLLNLKANSLKRSIALAKNPFASSSSSSSSSSTKKPKSSAGKGDDDKEERQEEDGKGEASKNTSASGLTSTSKSSSISTANVKNLLNRVVSQINSSRSKTKYGEVTEERLQELRRRFEEGKVPGVIGIRNHGNTCFINAILQCLSFTDIVAEYFVLDQYKSDLRRRRRRPPYVTHFQKRSNGRGEVTEQLATLLKSLWSLQYDPEISIRFKSLVEKHASQYKGSSQHDAQEFLLWLLDQVHEDLNMAKKKKYKVLKSQTNTNGATFSDEQLASEALANHMRCNNSFVMEVFQAQFRSSLTCHTCERQSNTFDPFLCVSLPIPQKQLLPVFVTVLYIDQCPRQVRIGLTVGAHETVADLRKTLAKDTGIPVEQVLLTEIGKLGFERTLRDNQPVSVLKEAKAPLYCIEMPRHKLATEDDGAYVVLTWVNLLKEGPIERRFGSPYTIQVSRETLYSDLQKLLMKEMAPILHDDILISAQKVPLFKIRVLDGFEGSLTYLDSSVDLPMYVESVEQAINLCKVEGDESSMAHVKLILEWDNPAKTQIVNDDSDVIEEHASVREVKDSPQEAGSVTLQECFDLYTSAERLGLQDAWHCPSCDRKQEVVKRMGLWSVPDVLVIHLKRFRQSSSATDKLSTMVEFPLEGFDMSPNVAKPAGTPPGANKDDTEGTSEDVGGASATASAPACTTSSSNTEHRDSSSAMRMLKPFSMWKPSKRLAIPSSRGKDDLVYDLYAVCNHHGSDLQGGHYTASCRNPTDGQWYSFDDMHTRTIAEKDVVSPDVYILFYQRQSLSPSSSASSSSSGSSNQEHWVFRMPDFAYKKKTGIVKVPSPTSSSPAKAKKTRIEKEGKDGQSQDEQSQVFQRNSAKYATLPTKRTTSDVASECEPDRYSDIVELDQKSNNGDGEEEGVQSERAKTATADGTKAGKEIAEDADNQCCEKTTKGGRDDDGISRPIDKNDVD